MTSELGGLLNDLSLHLGILISEKEEGGELVRDVQGETYLIYHLKNRDVELFCYKNCIGELVLTAEKGALTSEASYTIKPAYICAQAKIFSKSNTPLGRSIGKALQNTSQEGDRIVKLIPLTSLDEVKELVLEQISD